MKKYIVTRVIKPNFAGVSMPEEGEIVYWHKYNDMSILKSVESDEVLFVSKLDVEDCRVIKGNILNKPIEICLEEFNDETTFTSRIANC